jgi:hypothetical protein
VSRDLVSRDLVSRDLVSRDLVSRDLVSRDLVSRDLVSRDLVGSVIYRDLSAASSAASIGSIYRQHLSAASIGSVYGASQNRWDPGISGHSAHFPRFMLQCTKSTGTRAGDGSKDLRGVASAPSILVESAQACEHLGSCLADRGPWHTDQQESHACVGIVVFGFRRGGFKVVRVKG